MLAVGCSLHHPFQSIENGYRQFLTCNEIFSTKIIRQELIQALNKQSSNSSCQTQSTFQLYREWIRSRPKSSGRFSIRNCRLCGESFYHSHLHNLPWLRNCPLHPNEPLTENCPNCGRRWFSNSKACSCCGVSVRFLKILHNRQRIGANWDTLECLNSAVTKFHRKYHLGQVISGRTESLSINENDSIFPSIAAHLFPEYRLVFEKLGIDIEECDELIFKVESTSDKSMPCQRSCREEASSIEEVTEQIWSFVERGVAQQQGDRASESDLADASATAFALWRELVTTTYHYGLGYNVSTLCYKICFGVSGPGRPEQNDSLMFFDRNGGQHERMPIPGALQTTLYKYDLWLKYFSILEALLYFNSELPKPFDNRKPICGLAYPNLTSAQFIDIVHEDGKIRLISPAWMRNCDPIGLYRFSQKERKEQSLCSS